MEPNSAALVSGEGVRLALRSAGVGSRTIAAVIDIAIQSVGYFLLALLDVVAAGNSDADAVRAVLIVEVVLVLAGYPIVMEWSTRGRTLGKMCLGLRVVRDDGGPIGFRHALVRGLAGLVLEKPGLLFPLTTIAGLVTISSSSREKRLGDMLAGTVVLNEHAAPQRLAMPPGWVPFPLQQWVLSLDLHRLDDGLALVVRQFVSRAYAMTPAARYQLGEDLRDRVLAVVSPPPPPHVPTHDILQSVLAERRRRTLPPMSVASVVQPYPVSYQPVGPQPSPGPSDSPFARPS